MKTITKYEAKKLIRQMQPGQKITIQMRIDGLFSLVEESETEKPKAPTKK
jgi:hypothetical protein